MMTVLSIESGCHCQIICLLSLETFGPISKQRVRHTSYSKPISWWLVRKHLGGVVGAHRELVL